MDNSASNDELLVGPGVCRVILWCGMGYVALECVLMVAASWK